MTHMALVHQAFAGARGKAWGAVLTLGLAGFLAGCDTGGLLVVENKPQGPSVNEMVNGGTFAKNGQYKIFYSLGQPSPNQGIGKSQELQLKGGIVGAAHAH